MFTFGIFLSGTFHLNWNVWSGGFILDINYLSIFTDKLSYFQLYSRVGRVSSIGGEFISVRGGGVAGAWLTRRSAPPPARGGRSSCRWRCSSWTRCPCCGASSGSTSAGCWCLLQVEYCHSSMFLDGNILVWRYFNGRSVKWKLSMLSPDNEESDK